VFWLYDHSLLPDNSPFLRETLTIVLAEFVSGGTLYARRWRPLRPDLAGTLIGRLVMHVYTDRKSGLRVIENY
jgi:hypothetical protein